MLVLYLNQEIWVSLFHLHPFIQLLLLYYLDQAVFITPLPSQRLVRELSKFVRFPFWFQTWNSFFHLLFDRFEPNLPKTIDVCLVLRIIFYLFLLFWWRLFLLVLCCLQLSIVSNVLKNIVFFLLTQVIRIRVFIIYRFVVFWKIFIDNG